MKATELFCRQQNIRYLCVTGKLGDKVIDKDAVESKLDFTKKQLFIGANDQTALAIQDILDKQPGRAGHDIHLMGFDNIESARERKISSFDRNFQGVAESLLFLCKQFFKNPEARTLSCGQFVYPVFIRR